MLTKQEFLDVLKKELKRRGYSHIKCAVYENPPEEDIEDGFEYNEFFFTVKTIDGKEFVKGIAVTDFMMNEEYAERQAKMIIDSFVLAISDHYIVREVYSFDE